MCGQHALQKQLQCTQPFCLYRGLGEGAVQQGLIPRARCAIPSWLTLHWEPGRQARAFCRKGAASASSATGIGACQKPDRQAQCTQGGLEIVLHHVCKRVSPALAVDPRLLALDSWTRSATRAYVPETLSPTLKCCFRNTGRARCYMLSCAKHMLRFDLVLELSVRRLCQH